MRVFDRVLVGLIILLGGAPGFAADLPKDKSLKGYQRVLESLSHKSSVRVIVSPAIIEDEDREKGRATSGSKAQSSSERLSRLWASLQDVGARPEKRMKYSGNIVVELTRSQLERLRSDEILGSVHEDVLLSPSLVATVPFVGGSYASQQGFTGAGYAVAIIDTGVDSTHPMFPAGKIVEEACFSTNASGVTSNCPNGQVSQVGAGAGAQCVAAEGCAHGTHVAGIAGGEAYYWGGYEYKGVAYDAGIISVQVSSRHSSSSTCGQFGWPAPCALSYTSDIEEALAWISQGATTPDIAAINISLGGGSYPEFCPTSTYVDEIWELRKKGIVTVVATGNGYFNDGPGNAIAEPACVAQAVSVTATLSNHNYLASYANINATVDFAAPGDVRSAWTGGDLSMKKAEGTSMAAPHVAGAFAVMRQMNKYAGAERIEGVLKQTGYMMLAGQSGVTLPRLSLYFATQEFKDKPIAKLSRGSYSVKTDGPTIVFDASPSSSPSDEALVYHWDFGDGSPVSQTVIGGVTHTYPGEGRYKAQLYVSNGIKDSETITIPVTVYDPVKVVIGVVSSK